MSYEGEDTSAAKLGQHQERRPPSPLPPSSVFSLPPSLPPTSLSMEQPPTPRL
jgi:hypothetical protein